ncbi:OmpA family protein [Solimicrobium silvestre]|uniref:OmpA-like transmembrane domain n=1 Tax=Solimicrobium silvestre TaxID=2099400 RepID=A0A2S9H0K5_9BURK|nr:OmpA family protein [Solimicrobium silvestre]PRC93515.1 OmpA-like transmembrane domain [Solimicrobium silvestre]
MKCTRTLKNLSLIAFSAIAIPYAAAQENTTTQDTSAWYGGLNVGQSRAKIDDASITNRLLTEGASAMSINNNDRDTGFKIFGGYQFNKNFSIESGYFDLGKFGYSATTTPPGTLNGSITLRGLNIDAIGFLPFTENFSGFGRLGLNYSQAKDSFSGSGLAAVASSDPGKHDLNYKVGMGLQYRLTQALAMRAEVERYRVDDAIGNKGDIDLYSIGLVYRFGEKTQMHAAVYRPAAPAPIPEPTPEVVVVINQPPAPPPPIKVVFAADSMFDFNRADMRSDGKRFLDEFSANLKSASFDLISVTGHTDRIGSHDYNMKLSTRRAEAVKSYLVEVAGIPSNKIDAKGVDGVDPVTKPEECKGNKVTKALIACLQPDRRVEVEVTGTKK